MTKVIWKVLEFFPKLWVCNAFGTQNVYDKNFHEWKIIPLNLLNKYLGKNFNFHFLLLAKSSLIKHFPFYYLEIFCNWYKHFSSAVSVTSTIMSQLRFNKYTLIEKQSFLFPVMSNNDLYHAGQVFDDDVDDDDDDDDDDELLLWYG